MGLSGNEYEKEARIKLGFQIVSIFGTLSVTQSIKQIVAYTGYYIDKATADGELVRLPLSLENLSDRTMERAHTEPKSVRFLFSGGR